MSVPCPASVSSSTAPAITAARIAISSRTPSARANREPAERRRGCAGVGDRARRRLRGPPPRRRHGLGGNRGARLRARHPPRRRGRRAGGEHVGRQLIGRRRRLLTAQAGVERPREVAGRPVAGRRLALERTQNRLRERLRDVGVVRRRRQRALVLAPDRELGEGRALPGQAPGEQLVQHHAERVDVRGRGRLLAPGLLGGEIGSGADHRADLGEPRLRGRAGDPEVGELDRHLAGRRLVRGAVAAPATGRAADHHQVPGLDVAVDDPLAVRVLEPGACLDADLGGRVGAEPALGLQQLRDRLALDVLHDDVVALGVDPGVVDLDDVGVDQLRDRERLAAEAGHELVVVREVLGEDLHRDGSFQHPVGCPVDGRHAAGAEPIAELVTV